MKFYIKKIILWLDNGCKREIGEFKKNKVNVITGDPSKGKSSILEILDYCLLSSKNPIVQGDDYIDRVEWFGINFVINDKVFTIARHSTEIKDYYFSSSGYIPNEIFANIKEDNIKNALYSEFSINENVKFPFGGKKIKKNQIISYRYFMLFNTQTRDVLSHNRVLFDKQTNSKYQEALIRILDIALGVTTIDNMLKNEKLKELKKKKERIENKITFLTNKENDLIEYIDRAKYLQLIDYELSTEKSITKLTQILDDVYNFEIVNNEFAINELENRKVELTLKLSRYRKYKNQYAEYKKYLTNNADSLKPIAYLNSNKDNLLEGSDFSNIMHLLEKELIAINKFISNRKLPAINELNKEIKQIESDLSNVKDQIKNLFENEISVDKLRSQQLLFLGEIRNSFQHKTKDQDTQYTDELKKLEEQIKKLEEDIVPIDKADTLDTLSEYMQSIFKEVDFQLRGYSGYKPIFDDKDRLIKLKKIDETITMEESDKTIDNIGSSSNHLFLHLAFFMALHRLFIKKVEPSKFIPQFLIFDQPDSPFYEGSTTKSSEEKKLFMKSLKMLDNHINYFIDELKKDFQIIVLEHVEWNEIEKENFKHYHLIEEWRGYDGLVPLS